MPDLVVITGASADIGVALIRHILSSASYTEATVVAHSFGGAEKIAALQREFGADRVVALAADLSDRRNAEAFADEVLARGVPRAFVHLPALRLQHERFTKLDWTRFQKDMTLQVESAGTMLQRWLPKMAKLPDSRVVFVLSSVALGVPPKFMSAYTVVKYAQLGLMRALAAEYASSQVRINAIAPGMVETQFLGEIAEVAVQMSASANPLGRNATTQDLMGAFELLLSPGSSYIHGVTLPITAGIIA
jgi:3-oxoacyl-[acyl-carrier protein] reductase